MKLLKVYKNVDNVSNLKLLRSKGELDLDNKIEMCNKCCKYKSSLNENGVCKECEVTLCESCYENGERGICEECEYEFDGK